MAYSMMVGEYNDLIREQKDSAETAQEAGVSDDIQTGLEEWKERADEYSHKFTALAEGGLAEVASMTGLKASYQGFLKVRKKYKKYMGDGASDAHVNPTGSTIKPGGELDLEGLSNDVLDFVPGDMKTAAGQLVNKAKSALTKVKGVADSAGTKAAKVIDPSRAGSQAPVNVDGGDASLTGDDLDNIISRNLADVNEGVGRQAQNLTQRVSGITYGKTGAGADIADAGGAAAPRSASLADQLQNMRQSLRGTAVEGAGSNAVSSVNPIDVGKIGVKKTITKIEGGALDNKLIPKPAGPTPTALGPTFARQADADLAQKTQLQASLKEKFAQLPKEDRQKLIQKQNEGQLPQESVGELQDLDAQISSRLKQVSQTQAQTGDFLAGIEQRGKSVAADVRATAGVKPPAPDPEQEVGEPVEKSAVKVGEKAVEKEGEDVGEKFAADEAIGSVAGPIGEAIGAVAGIFSTIDGLVHLFHHKKQSLPQVNQNIGTPEINTQITSKFSSAIPTIDSAQEVSGAIASF